MNKLILLVLFFSVKAFALSDSNKIKVDIKKIDQTLIKIQKKKDVLMEKLIDGNSEESSKSIEKKIDRLERIEKKYKKKKQKLKAQLDEEVEIEDIPEEEVEKPKKKRKDKDGKIVDHLFSFGYDLKTKGDLKDGSATVVTGYFDSEFEWDQAFSIAFEYRETKKNGWGSSFGVMYHTERELKEAAITVPGEGTTTTKYDSGKSPTISIFRIVSNAIYRWDNFYIPFGLNFSGVNFTPSSGNPLDWESSGGLGFNLGFGFYISERACIEYGAQSAAWNLEASDGIDTISYGNGTLTTTTLQLKYKFN